MKHNNLKHKDMKQKESKNVAEMQEKRMKLRELSNALVSARDKGQYMGNEDDTVNGLLRFYYACKGFKNLKTFSEWKKDGFSVKKGEKALLVWGSPVSFNKKKEEDTAKEAEQEEEKKKDDDYFPLCYLFAECQVHKITKSQKND